MRSALSDPVGEYAKDFIWRIALAHRRSFRGAASPPSIDRGRRREVEGDDAWIKKNKLVDQSRN